MISVERYSEDRLTRQVWEFWFFERDMTLYLDRYADETRTTKRHGFKATCCWRRLMRTRNDIEIEDVPFPRDVQDEAMYHLTLSLSVKKTRPATT